MTTLQQWKEKLLDILDDVFYRKPEIDQKESVINNLINSKAESIHTHGNLQNDGVIGTNNNISQNVVTDATGKITTEAKPTIPTKTSDLTNDSNFLTEHQNISGKEDTTNKITSWSNPLSDINYPSEKLVKETIENEKGINIKFIDDESEVDNDAIYILGLNDKEYNCAWYDDNSNGYMDMVYGYDNLGNQRYATFSTEANTFGNTNRKIEVTSTSINHLIFPVDLQNLQSWGDYEISGEIKTPYYVELLIQEKYYNNGYKYNLVKKWTIENELATNEWMKVKIIYTNDSLTLQYSFDGTNWDTLNGVDGTSTTHSEFRFQFGERSGDDRVIRFKYFKFYNVLDGDKQVIIKKDENVVHVLDETKFLTEHQDISGKEDKANKVTSWSQTTSNDKYPSEKLVNDSLKNKIDKSSTSGLVKNDGTIDTNNYLTQHQDITGKEDKSNIVTSFSNPTDTQYPSAKLVNDSITGLENNINNKISKSSTNGLVKNDGTIDTNTYLTQHQDITGKENISNKVTEWESTLSDEKYPSEKLVKETIDNLSEQVSQNNIDTITLIITYGDDSTETVDFLISNNGD